MVTESIDLNWRGPPDQNQFLTGSQEDTDSICTVITLQFYIKGFSDVISLSLKEATIIS